MFWATQNRICISALFTYKLTVGNLNSLCLTNYGTKHKDCAGCEEKCKSTFGMCQSLKKLWSFIEFKNCGRQKKGKLILKCFLAAKLPLKCTTAVK